MSITPEQIEHIAHLSRIELDHETKKVIERDMPEILLFIEKLNELNTDEVDAMQPYNNPLILENVMREDEQIDTYMENKSASLIEVAPEKEGNLIKVKSVFE